MTDQTTHQPLTDQQLDEVDARSNAATKGPWGFYDGDNYADVAADLQMTGRGSYSYREKIARLEDENYWDDSAHEDDDEERAPEQMAANAAFIAHAREDVPALVAEVRRLRTQLAAVHGLCDEQDQVARMLEFATPPWIGAVRAVVQSADVDEMAASLRRDGFGPDQIATMLRRAADEAQQPTETDDLRTRAEACAEGDCPHAHQARNAESKAAGYRHELETLEAYLEDRDGIDPAVAATLRGILGRALDR